METTELYPHIFTRKSTRAFDMTPLSAETLDRIETFIKGVKPLLPGSEITHKIAGPGEVKGIGIAKAPHYFLISGKEQQLKDACAGFLYQYAELYLHAGGLSARWLAGAKGKQPDPDWIIGIAFGKPAEEPCTRTLAEFKRKSLGEISRGEDPRIEAARLAPSGMNGQPWYYIADHGALHTYYKKSLGGLAGGLYHLTELDAGIALCHIAVASEHEGIPVGFSADKKDAPEPPKGFTYIGTVE
ncbi:MAG: hypothetical protein LBS85_00550 [Clostridiales Family XIII bacterium]|jgi:hypothetical protein|nr:hypothetical protein [Clostridiales Family XIII bacterium]